MSHIDTRMHCNFIFLMTSNEYVAKHVLILKKTEVDKSYILCKGH